jgi:hypothetical protein
VNNQLGNKAYRLDHSLQTHFSEPVMRQNSLRFPRNGGDGSERRVLSMGAARQALGLEGAALIRRLADGTKMAPSQRHQLAFGAARATRARRQPPRSGGRARAAASLNGRGF